MIRALHTFKNVHNASCATCGQEWFGPIADDLARKHAVDTKHQVTITMEVRETHNAPESDYALRMPMPRVEAPKPAPPMPARSQAAANSSIRGRATYAGADAGETFELRRRWGHEAQP